MCGSAISRWWRAQVCCWRWRCGAGGAVTGRCDLDCRCADAAEAPLAAVIVFERAQKTLLIEIRPQTVAEMQFRERAFPEEKVAQTPFVAGTDQEIDLARGMEAMVDVMQQAVRSEER